jgi:hypothetical protein
VFGEDATAKLHVTLGWGKIMKRTLGYEVFKSRKGPEGRSSSSSGGGDKTYEKAAEIVYETPYSVSYEAPYIRLSLNREAISYLNTRKLSLTQAMMLKDSHYQKALQKIPEIKNRVESFVSVLISQKNRCHLI